MRQVSGTSRAPVGLDAATIVTTALELLDQHGLDGFSMRRLSAHLGVTEPTVYWHVGTKAELSAAIVERVLTGAEPDADPRQDWEDRLRTFFSDARALLLAHPSVVDLMRFSLPPTVERWAKGVLQILLDAGFDDSSAATYARIAMWQVIGFARVEADLITRSPVIEAVENEDGRPVYRVRPELMPEVPTRAQSILGSVDLNVHHEAALDVFIAGIRRASDALPATMNASAPKRRALTGNRPRPPTAPRGGSDRR